LESKLTREDLFEILGNAGCTDINAARNPIHAHEFERLSQIIQSAVHWATRKQAGKYAQLSRDYQNLEDLALKHGIIIRGLTKGHSNLCACKNAANGCDIQRSDCRVGRCIKNAFNTNGAQNDA